MKITDRISLPIPIRGGRCTCSTDVGMWHPRSLHPTTERATLLIPREAEEKWEFWRYDMNKIVILGYCWKSQQNGAVYDVGGGISLSQLRSALRS
jgi:hypothetical protein